MAGKTAIIAEPLPAGKSIHPVLWKDKTSVMKTNYFLVERVMIE